MKLPKRDRDVRIQITKRVFGEYASRYWINKGTVMDGCLDKDGNFVTTAPASHVDYFSEEEVTIYPSHFKILGKFYFRKSK